MGETHNRSTGPTQVSPAAVPAAAAHRLPEGPSSDFVSDERPGFRVLPPMTALLEILVLLVLPAALDYWWPAFPQLADMQPHLFWLPVLLLSLQYGTISGLLAAGVAILLSAVLGWPDQEIGENHFNYLLRIWTQPMLWLVAAILLGQFRTRQIEQTQQLNRQVAEMASQRTILADHARSLRGRCEMLERLIAGRTDPDSRALLNHLARLDSGDGNEATAFAEALRLTFGDCQAAVCVHQDGELVLVSRVGTGRSGVTDRFRPGNPIYEHIARHGQALSVMTPGDEGVLAQEGVAAVPIMARDGASVVGMLKLEAADPTGLDAHTADRLSVIARHLAPLIEPGGASWRHGRMPAAVIAGDRDLRSRPRLWRQVKWHDVRAKRTIARSKSGTG